MARHYIGDRKGKGGTFYSDRDGDSKNRQTVYKDTGSGSRKVDGVHYNPKKGKYSR